MPGLMRNLAVAWIRSIVANILSRLRPGLGSGVSPRHAESLRGVNNVVLSADADLDEIWEFIARDDADAALKNLG